MLSNGTTMFPKKTYITELKYGCVSVNVDAHRKFRQPVRALHHWFLDALLGDMESITSLLIDLIWATQQCEIRGAYHRLSPLL